MAVALARSMPGAGVRPDLDNCQQLYAPLWGGYLRDKGVDWDGTHAANTAWHHLKSQHVPEGLLYWEKQGTNASTSSRDTFAGFAAGQGMWNQWSPFAGGMSLLVRLAGQTACPRATL